MAKIANKITDDEKLARFKRKPNSTPVKATKEYLKASLEEKNKDKKKAVKGEFVKENTNNKTNVQETNKYDRSKETTKVNNSNRNSHYDSSSTYKKINNTVKNNTVQIDQEKFNAWMDDNKNRNPISSEQNLQNKLEGKKKANSNGLQETYNNTFERLTAIPEQIATGLAAIPFQGYDIVKEAFGKGKLDDLIEKYIPSEEIDIVGDVIDIYSIIANKINPNLKNFSANDENNLSSKINQAAQDKAVDILDGTQGLEKGTLNTMMVVGNVLAHLAVSKLSGGLLAPNATMAIQTGVNSTYDNLQKGYDIETSVANGILKGYITKFTESQTVENLNNVITSGLGKFLLGGLLKSSVNEALEEGVEYGMNWGLDALQLGDTEEYSTGGLFENMFYGLTSGLVLAGGEQAIYQVKTKKQYNQLKADMETVAEYASQVELSDAEKYVYNKTMAAAQTALNNFDNESIIGDFIQYEIDNPVKLSVREILDGFDKYIQPDNDLNTRKEMYSKVLDTTQQFLYKKGINMDVVQYTSLDENVKTQVDKVQSWANDLGVKLAFDTNVSESGSYDPNTGITIVNPNSTLAPLTAFTHEITHGVEASKFYPILDKLIIGNNDISNEIKNIQEHYAKAGVELDVDGARKEYVAIQTQELLGNEEFVNRLVKYNNNIAYRIYEGIKHIVAKTNTLQEIEYNFLKAFREYGLNSGQTQKQYLYDKNKKELKIDSETIDRNFEEVAKMNPVYHVTENDMNTSLRGKELTNAIYEVFNEHDNLAINDVIGPILLNRSSAKNDVGHIKSSLQVATVKAIIPTLENGKIVEVTTKEESGKNADSILIVAPIELNPSLTESNQTRAYLLARVKQDTNNNRFYLHDISLKEINKKGNAKPLTGSPFKKEITGGNTLPTNILNQNDGNIKESNVLSNDNLGRTLSNEQKEYFKNTKVVDDAGNLKVMYRGGNEDIEVFDRRKSKSSNLYGRGFYFTDTESHAAQYGDVKEYYLNIENPLSSKDFNITEEQLLNLLYAVQEDGEDYDLSGYGYGATPESIANDIYGKSDFDMLQDISLTAIGDLVHTVEWFNEVNDTNYDGFILPTETVVFNSNQIKTIENKNPTKNQNVQYSIGLSKADLTDRVKGDDYLNALDTIEILKNVNAEIDEKGYVTLHHRTNPENAKKILESKKMLGKEDGIFFSTNKNGLNNSGYGESIVTIKAPVEMLEIDDIFDDEASIRIPLTNRNRVLDVSNFIEDSLQNMTIIQKDREQRRVLNEIESKDITLLDKAIEIITYLHENEEYMTRSGIEKFKNTANAHGAGFNTPEEYRFYETLSYENSNIDELESMLKEHKKLEMEYSLSGGQVLNNTDLTRERYIINRILDELNKAKNEELELKGRQTFESKPTTTEQQLLLNRLGEIKYYMYNGRYHVEAYNKNGNTEVNSSYEPNYLVKLFGTDIANKIITTATSRPNTITEINHDTSFMDENYVNDIVKKAKKQYGLTTNPIEAGYMTLDGKWLDFSGKRDGGPANVRNMDHIEVDIDGVDAEDFIKMGNIRLQPESNGFQLLLKPNEKQRKSLVKFLESVHGHDEGYFIGFVDEKRVFNNVDHLEFDMNTNPKTILNEIDKHFDKEKIQYSIGLSAKEIRESYKQYKEIDDNFVNSFSQIVNKKDMDADYKELLSSTVLEKIKTGKISYEKLETLKNETWNRLYDYEVNPEYETYKTVRDIIRNQKISMSSLGFNDNRFEENKRGISDFAGKKEWNEFRKKRIGTLKFVKDGGTDIDEIYTSLIREYPGLLEENANNGYDQLMEIANYLDNKQEETYKVHQSEQGVTYEIFEEDFNNKIENMIHSIDTKKEISILMSKENIRSNPDKAILNAGGIIPNHDIIRQKYPEFSDLNFNKALLEQYTNGRATDETVKALKEDLIKNVYGNDVSQGNIAAKQVDEFLNDSIEHFLAHSKYETNKEYMSSIASQANELLKSYNSLDREKIESTYNQVEMKEKAKELIKKKNQKRRVSVAHTVDNLIFNGSNTKMSMFKTMEQNLDVVANGNVQLRNDLRDTLEMKRFEAQNEYKELLEKYGAVNDYIVNELGIKGKSKESKGMQWFMELHKEDGSSYSQQQLLLDFDYTMKNGKKAYENIMEAAKLQSEAYDEMYTLTNERREDIYGDIDINNELQTKELKAEYQQAKHTMQQISDELRNHPTEKLEAAYEQAREEVRKLYKKLESKIQRDENGDSTRRQKLQYRKNYAHHIVKKGFLSSLMGKIDGSAVREVPTYLAGISDDAEPKTGFAKFFSKQTGGAYEADAVNGFAEYIKDAARIIAYDPYIDYVRGFADDIRAVAQDDEMSQFTRYLTDYANDIAGKTGKIDRAVREMVGDKAFGVIKTLNSRVKANAILGNIRTATTQIFNIPNALGVLADNGGAATTQDVMKGVTSYMNSILTNQNDDSDASPFITSRYFDVNTQSKGIGAKLENLSNFMLSKGDEISTKMIWNAAYQQALRTNQENPIFYADDLTRRAVAGRGVGEVPLALQSQFMNLVIPFQVETNNAFRTLSSKVKDKKVGSVLTILLANWIFNAISETLYGDRLLFDPIDVIAEAIDDYKEDEEKDELESIKNTIKRLFGETLGNIPGGTYLPMILGWNEDESQNFFGESDPSRYGTGNIGLSVFGSALQDIDKGNYLDAASDLAANFLLPGGGKQAQRTIEALQVNGMLPQYENGQLIKEPVYYTGSGKVGYVTNPDGIMESPENFFDFAKQIMFGKWAGKNAQEYIDSGFKSMGQTQTNIFDALSEGMNKSDSFNMAKEVYEAKKEMTGEDGKYQFIEYLSSDDFTSEQRNEIYDTYYGDSNLTVRINEFASSCKLDADQTFEVKKILSTTASLKNSSGESVRNSKALSIRKQLDELGLYDDVVKYINDNNLDFGDMGLNKTVGGMTNSEFESEYKSIYGQSYSSTTDDDLASAYAATFGGTKSKGGSKKSSSTKSLSKSNKTSSNKVVEENTFSFDVEKAKIDNILAKVYGGSTSTNEAYKKINNIVKKVKSNKVDSKINIKSKYSKLIDAYLKNHPENAYFFK